MEHLDQRTKLTIMFTIVASMLFAALNQTIVGTALPRIISELGGIDLYSWVFTIYMLTSSVTAILVGKLSDMYGRKPFLLIGLAVFALGAFLCGTSSGIIQLIIYRGVQGFGGGMIMSTASSAVGDLFAPRERGKWQGILGAAFGVASVVGPLLGGYIVDHLAWHWVFWVNLPVGIIAFYMIARLFPKVDRKNQERIDYSGAFTLTLVLVFALLAFSFAGTKYEWGSGQILGLFGAAIVALILFVIAERRASSPILPLELFKNSIFVVSNLAGLLTGMGMFGAIMYIPLFVQGVMGVSATNSGLVTSPMMIGMVFASFISGQISSRTGRYKWMAVLGTAIFSYGMYRLTLMDISTHSSTVTVNMVTIGFGLGLSFPIFMLAVQNAVHQKWLGVATSSSQLFRQIGGTIGVSVLGTVLTHQLQKQLPLFMPKEAAQLMQNPQFASIGGALKNPQVLVDPAKLDQIRTLVPVPLKPIFEQVLGGLKHALAASIQEVFFFGFLLVLASLVVTLFLKEIPLRQRGVEPTSKSVIEG